MDWKREKQMMNAAVDGLIGVQLKHVGKRPFRKDQITSHVILHYEVPGKADTRVAILLREYIGGRVTRAVNGSRDANGRRTYGWYSADGERRYQRSRIMSRMRFENWAEEYKENRDRVDAQDDFIQAVRRKAEQLQLDLDAPITEAWDAVEEAA